MKSSIFNPESLRSRLAGVSITTGNHTAAMILFPTFRRKKESKEGILVKYLTSRFDMKTT